MSHDAFQRRFRTAAGFRKVSPQLEPLLRAFYDALDADARRVAAALDDLFSFLSDPAGRTDANCCATDYFFSALDEDEPRLEALPATLRGIIRDIGGALHDTIYAEHIASHFGSLPEQILQRIRDTRLE